MSENGVNGHSGAVGMQWRVGFMNRSLKYLTAESFGNKVNASGTQMKKKQIWFLEQQEKFVYIKSHLGLYLTTDKYGNLSAGAEAEDKADGCFTVQYSADGKWAFFNEKHKIYLHGVDTQASCSKTLGDENWWSIQLDVHPQVCLRNVQRKRYAHLKEDELECSEVIPWGADSLLTLHFVEGRYALKSCDGRNLHRDGFLQDDIDDNTLFLMEIRDGSLAFKDCNGLYLTSVSQGKMKTKNKSPGKDELFTIEDSHPQVHVKSYNGKYVSVKQGVDVSANQESGEQNKLGDTEIFQLEYNKPSDTWAFRTCKNNCWLQETGGVQVKDTDPTKASFYALEWQDDGTVGIKGSDGKYLSNKQTGSLYSASSDLGDQQKFKIILVNRPLLILKCEYGFVGTKGDQYICSKAKYDVLAVESTSRDTYVIKGPGGKYFGIGDDGGACSEDSPTEFRFEFCGQSVLAIRAPNGLYLKGEQNGLLKAKAEDRASATAWEY